MCPHASTLRPGRWLGFTLAALVPAGLAWFFWSTTPPVGGYAQPPSASPVPTPAPYEPASADPSSLYAQNCASCHGATLGGTATAPGLKRAGWPYAGKPDLLVRVIYEGRGLKMPSFGGRLSQQQIEALAGWIENANGAGATE